MQFGNYNSSASSTYELNKYTANVSGGDKLTTLEPGDDPATRNWGQKWRTPTLDEVKDLCDSCTWELVWNDDEKTKLKGYTVSNNGSSIFLPAADYRDGADLKLAGSALLRH